MTDPIGHWARLELAPWDGFAVDRGTLEAELRAAAENPCVFLFHVADGAVSFEEKPAASHVHHAMLADRAAHYAAFMRDALTGFGVMGRGLLALDLRDVSAARFSVPVFAFQKRRGSNKILLPDIDMIISRWFIDEPTDAVAYDDKLPAAIFVGATTGNSPLTAAIVREGRNPRLRAAAFFKDRADVVFELPLIVQHDTDETRAMIEALGVQGRRRDWAEQSRYRYMLSMDGNGATCSRVWRALSGDCVLVKYNSPHLLYYFHGLEAWRHYLPVADDADVLAHLTGAGRHDALHRAIAERSSAFARDHLSRPGMLRYMARLLGGYLSRFGEGAHWPGTPPLLVDAHAHVGGVGDIWAEPAGWLGAGDGAIEGLALVPGVGIAPGDIRLAVAGPEGVLSPAVGGHVLAGARGTGRPLHGVQIMLKGVAATRFDLAYETRFRDGTRDGPLPAGTTSIGETPLTGLRLHVTPRG